MFALLGFLEVLGFVVVGMAARALFMLTALAVVVLPVVAVFALVESARRLGKNHRLHAVV